MSEKLKKLFQLNDSRVIGLDIGTSSVRMVEMQKDEKGYSVKAANITEITQKSDDARPGNNEIIKAIKKCIANSKTRTRLAVCSVSGTHKTTDRTRVPVRGRRWHSLPASGVVAHPSSHRNLVDVYTIGFRRLGGSRG